MWIAVARLLVVLFLCVAVFSFSTHQHASKHQAIESGSLAQCGHWAFFRASQLLGHSLGKSDVGCLPIRDSGMTMHELADGFRRLGLPCRIKTGLYETDLERNRVAVLKLNSPDHFVVAAMGPTGKLMYHWGDKSPTTEDTTSVMDRFAGVWLEVERFQHEPTLSPIFDVSTLAVDVGPINYSEALGRTPSFDFEVTNRGAQPLRIIGVQAGCDCIQVAWPREEIKKGEAVTISAQYFPKPKKSNGYFERRFVVETNDPKRPFVTLQVSGVFVGRVEFYPSVIKIGSLQSSQRVKSLLLVDLPPGVTQFENIEFTQLNKSISAEFKRISIDEYNRAMTKIGPGYVPITDSGSLLAFELEVYRSGDSGSGLCEETFSFSAGRESQIRGEIAVQTYLIGP